MGKQLTCSQIRDILTGQNHQQIFVIIAIDLSAELYRWEVEGQKLRPAAEKRLDIFAEGDREKLEEFVLEMKKVLTQVDKDERRLLDERVKEAKETAEFQEMMASGDEVKMQQGLMSSCSGDSNGQ